MGFIKNRYISRTFIQPHQHDREDNVKIKLNPTQAVVQGKRVVLVEEIAQIIGADSLVYLSVDHARQIAATGQAEGFCTACFSGDYPADIPKHNKKSRFEQGISHMQKEDNP